MAWWPSCLVCFKEWKNSLPLAPSWGASSELEEFAMEWGCAEGYPSARRETAVSAARDISQCREGYRSAG